MKRLLPIFLFLFLFASEDLFSQKSPSGSYTLEEAPQKKIKERKDRIVVDFSYDGWSGLPPGIQQKPYSLGGNAYLMWDYPMGYGPLSIAFGAGFSTHNVHTNGEITYSIDGKYTSLQPITRPYKRNKLSCNYVEIPLELRIRTGANSHGFKLAIGGRIGYMYNAHTKVIDDDGKRKVYWIKNLNPWRYGVSFRIGYDKYTIQGFYALSELFDKGNGPKMVPYSIGVGLLLY
ncbi:MAG: PorT family protein [Bacteroidetes bacterium]|nr:PorT family protein [Bacteroidota bacterium]